MTNSAIVWVLIAFGVYLIGMVFIGAFLTSTRMPYIIETATIIPLNRKDINMWAAEHWKEYEIIDTSDGEKLERWGRYLLINCMGADCIRSLSDRNGFYRRCLYEA